jgi:glycerophosphoryl diester phosphodiesterase
MYIFNLPRHNVVFGGTCDIRHNVVLIVPTATLKEFSKYASVLGPDKAMLIDMSLDQARERIALARSYNLAIHPWTFK